MRGSQVWTLFYWEGREHDIIELELLDRDGSDITESR